MVRVAKVHGVHAEPGWFPLPGGRRASDPDYDRPEHCWHPRRGDEADAAPEAPKLSPAEEREANRRARAAVEFVLGLEPLPCESEPPGDDPPAESRGVELLSARAIRRLTRLIRSLPAVLPNRQTQDAPGRTGTAADDTQDVRKSPSDE